MVGSSDEELLFKVKKQLRNRDEDDANMCCSRQMEW